MASISSYDGLKGSGQVRWISCVSAGVTCVAGGTWTPARSPSSSCTFHEPCLLPLVLTYNDGHWQPAAAALFTKGYYGAFVTSLACTSAHSCDAIVTEMSSGSGPGFNNVVEHFNGSTWSAVQLPKEPFQEQWEAVTCPTVTNCVLVGNNGYITTANSSRILEELNGHWLAAVDEPDSNLVAISCQSIASCWAVGSRPESSGRSTTLALELAKGRWQQVSSATVEGAVVTLVETACQSGTSCVAVGDSPSASFHIRNVIEVLKGDHWVLAHGPAIPTDRQSVAAVSCGTHWGCLVVGGADEDAIAGTPEMLVVTPGGSWRPVGDNLPSHGSFVSLSCVLPTQCFTADRTGIVSIAAS